MSSLSTGLKQQLKISQCNAKTLSVIGGDLVFEAMINPASYKSVSSVKYGESPSQGMGSEVKFNKVCPEEYSFQDLVLDGTGVVPLFGLKSVKDQIARLRNVAFKYIGKNHETPIVQVSWGPLLFNARLKKLSVNYTLFKPSGEPLRAKVNLEFVSYKPTSELALGAANQSPDLTHLVEVKAGDTLPNLCYRIYSDTSYCAAVARINQLSSFRCLQLGQVLRFPPLV